MAQSGPDLSFDPDLDHLPPEIRWREWMGRVEAVIFASPEPVPREVLSRLVGRACRLDDVIADIQHELQARPFELVFVAGGWHHRTRPRYAEAIRLVQQPQAGSGDRDLSSAERLVVTAIAYLQPVTRKELSRLFGKEVSRDVIARLKRLDFIGAGPRAPEPGAPLTYVTTSKFLSVFGFASLRDLPDIEALEEAGLLQPTAETNEPVDALDRELGPVGDDRD
ncbi:SMC-Scp complex subunit ScpB [Microvirga arsenatis]|uniref:SMC-Scp complex subunit ScpB n=1 Tax=Microvirga arsenatis TaxID=2692265 RepID=A0ABW9Z284_9HYPH|nr:SMC-Scp complex subunit ScpB [Microvirga arsenatis]NBJ12989.1 SMC-Scp complex subunit ScpB [Microvirga arsenatis]NBJ26787.1 SMC-Scp complex subunit ScpB [Microvirga arsenatis]